MCETQSTDATIAVEGSNCPLDYDYTSQINLETSINSSKTLCPTFLINGNGNRHVLRHIVICRSKECHITLLIMCWTPCQLFILNVSQVATTMEMAGSYRQVGTHSEDKNKHFKKFHDYCKGNAVEKFQKCINLQSITTVGRFFLGYMDGKCNKQFISKNTISKTFSIVFRFFS